MMEKTFKLLAQKKLSVTCFESASGGFIAYRLSQSRYSGDILYGSLVCYDLKVKENILKVNHSLIEKFTPESEEVTLELIKRGKKKFKSDIYISCTGLLKKGGSENKNKPVGTFFYAIYYNKKYFNFRLKTKGKPNEKLKTLFSAICKSLYKILKNKPCE